jgi:Protein of unknown function (DUF1232)
VAFEKTRTLHKLWRYVRDRRVPLWRKLVGVAAVAYLIWPFDLIPDFIPFIGWLDDAGVLMAAAVFLVRDVRLHEQRYPEFPVPDERPSRPSDADTPYAGEQSPVPRREMSADYGVKVRCGLTPTVRFPGECGRRPGNGLCVWPL